MAGGLPAEYAKAEGGGEFVGVDDLEAHVDGRALLVLVFDLGLGEAEPQSKHQLTGFRPLKPSRA